MMRIGDCGDIIGNDYAMLNCEQGYSVDRPVIALMVVSQFSMIIIEF